MKANEVRFPMWRHLLVLLPPYLWLLFFFLLPFGIVLRVSLSSDVLAQPPYSPVLDLYSGWSGAKEFVNALHLENYWFVLSDPVFVDSILQSVKIAALSTAILLLVGYPIAHAMARSSRAIRPYLLVAVIVPFWTSFLIRIYAWIGILSREGFLNQALLPLGIVDQPLDILATNAAVYIGIVYSYLPFMVLPLYAAIERTDESVLEAAADLGAVPFVVFWRVTLPLSLPGAIAGSLLCFIPAVGEFLIPDLLGGSDTLMLGKTLWTEFAVNRSWTTASAVAVVMLASLVIPILFYERRQARAVNG